MTCGGISEKDVAAAFENLSITSNKTTKHTINIEKRLLCRAMYNIRKSKNRAGIKAIMKIVIVILLLLPIIMMIIMIMAIIIKPMPQIFIKIVLLLFLIIVSNS